MDSNPKSEGALPSWRAAQSHGRRTIFIRLIQTFRARLARRYAQSSKSYTQNNCKLEIELYSLGRSFMSSQPIKHLDRSVVGTPSRCKSAADGAVRIREAAGASPAISTIVQAKGKHESLRFAPCAAHMPLYPNSRGNRLKSDSVSVQIRRVVRYGE